MLPQGKNAPSVVKPLDMLIFSHRSVIFIPFIAIFLFPFKNNNAMSQTLTEREKLLLEIKRDPFEPVLEKKEKRKKRKRKEAKSQTEKRRRKKDKKLEQIEIKGIISSLFQGKWKGVVILEVGAKSYVIPSGSSIKGVHVKNIHGLSAELEINSKKVIFSIENQNASSSMNGKSQNRKREKTSGGHGISPERKGALEKERKQGNNNEKKINIYSHGAKLSDVLIGISYVSGVNIIAPPELEKTRIFITAKWIPLPSFFDILSELGISKKRKEHYYFSL